MQRSCFMVIFFVTRHQRRRRHLARIIFALASSYILLPCLLFKYLQSIRLKYFKEIAISYAVFHVLSLKVPNRLFLGFEWSIRHLYLSICAVQMAHCSDFIETDFLVN